MIAGPVTGIPWSTLISCEHGGNDVPADFRSLFKGAEPALASHRGWDAGALVLARTMADALGSPLFVSTVSRLLVDLNRSPTNPRVWSEWSRALTPDQRRKLLADHHTPYRERVHQAIVAGCAGGGTVLHLGVHSFTPVMNGAVRRPDLALLYDPARPAERELCADWTEVLRAALPGFRVHRNDPYRGASDGLTTWLRRRHTGRRYLGVEVEVNQRLLDENGRLPQQVVRALIDGLAEVGTMMRSR